MKILAFKHTVIKTLKHQQIFRFRGDTINVLQNLKIHKCRFENLLSSSSDEKTCRRFHIKTPCTF